MVESMMYVGQTPWHGLGVSVPSEVTSAEAIKLAGLDWTVETVPVFATQLDATDGPQATMVDGYRAVVRTSDRSALGIVGERYQLIQNVNAFAFFDAVVGESQAIYHTAGSLDSGRKVWMLAKLPGEIRVAGDDVTEKHLLLCNSHDGSSALRMFFTSVRVVCQNTLNIAMRAGQGDGFTIRHTASATARIEQARHALELANDSFDDFAAEAEMLGASRYTDDQMWRLTEVLFPTTLDAPSTRIKKNREKLVDLFENGRAHEPIRGTAWAALQAVTEYVDHHRGTRSATPALRAEARLTSAWFGSGAQMKQRAFTTIRHQLAA
jgi:phage/plasmid-like protein (TIGR03299 family)